MSQTFPRFREERAWRLLWATSGMLLLAGCKTLQPLATQPAGPPPAIVTVRADFDLQDPGDSWSFRTRGQWRVAMEDGSQFLQMALPMRGTPVIGSAPPEYAIYNRYQFRSFSLSLRVRAAESGSPGARDVCLIFGRSDDEHLYYADLATQPGPHNALIKVTGRAGQTLAAWPGGKPGLSPGWHRVDLLRDADAGTIRLYVDANESGAKLTFEAVDRSYEWGDLALGSFDHADFARVLIEGQARPRPRP